MIADVRLPKEDEEIDTTKGFEENGGASCVRRRGAREQRVAW
jgi:hypothetical protein